MNSAKKQKKNNQMGKIRDLFKKTESIKGTFHASMGTTKDRNGKDLTEAEELLLFQIPKPDRCEYI